MVAGVNGAHTFYSDRRTPPLLLISSRISTSYALLLNIMDYFRQPAILRTRLSPKRRRQSPGTRERLDNTRGMLLFCIRIEYLSSGKCVFMLEICISACSRMEKFANAIGGVRSSPNVPFRKTILIDGRYSRMYFTNKFDDVWYKKVRFE